VGRGAENSEFRIQNSEFKEEGEEAQIRWGWADGVVVVIKKIMKDRY